MTHVYHDALPGFSPNQILHDGCGECESRSQCDDHGISSLDSGNFLRAVERASAWNKTGLSDISHAERPLLSALWSMYLQFERAGVWAFKVPS